MEFYPLPALEGVIPDTLALLSIRNILLFNDLIVGLQIAYYNYANNKTGVNMNDYGKVSKEMLLVLEEHFDFNEKEKTEALLLILKMLEDEELFE